MLRVTRVGFQVGGFIKEDARVIPVPDSTLLNSFHRNNWLTNVVIERAWQTDVTMSQSTLAEERWGLRSRPVMTQRAQLTGLSQNESADLLMHFARLAQHGCPTPLYPDRTRLTQVYSTGNRIYCDTTHRRFFIGQRVSIVPRDWGVVSVSGTYTPVEYALISSVTSTYLDLVDPLSSSTGYQVGSWVYPLFDAHPILRVDYNRSTRQIIDGVLSWTEVSGASTIPSVLQTPSGTPETFVYHDGLPIFDMTMNGTILGSVVREGAAFVSGRGGSTSVHGPTSRLTIDAEFKLVTRANWWRMASFFDLVQGRAFPFWFVNPQRLWELDSVQSSTKFRVKRTHFYYMFDPTSGASLNEPTWLQWFALVETDGTVHISKILDVEEVTQDTWDITVSDALPTSGIKRITAAHKSRLGEDYIEENWYTFGTVTTRLSLMEVLNEKTVSITNL